MNAASKTAKIVSAKDKVRFSLLGLRSALSEREDAIKAADAALAAKEAEHAAEVSAFLRTAGSPGPHKFKLDGELHFVTFRKSGELADGSPRYRAKIEKDVDVGE